MEPHSPIQPSEVRSMILQTRCKRCGRLFARDREGIIAGRWRLCPDCRNPSPPSAAVAVAPVTFPPTSEVLAS